MEIRQSVNSSIPQSLCLVVPGRLDSLTGGYIYDRRIVEGLRRRGWSCDVHEIDAGFPFPSPAALEHANRVLTVIPDGTVVLVDGLAFGAMPDLVERHAVRLRFVPIVHLPLAADVGLDTATAERLRTSEAQALSRAALVVVTGKAALPLLAGYDIPRERILLVEPGTDRDSGPDSTILAGGRTARYRADAATRLLCVATLNPGKGHEILMRSLALLPNRDWHLTCVGSLTRHPSTAGQILALVGVLGLERRVLFLGELDATHLAQEYDRADVFVLPTLRETYGMAVAEAIAHELPVVSTTTGAIPELVGDEAGLLLPPGDTEAFTAALGRVLDDPDLRQRMASASARARLRLPSWEQAVETMAAALTSRLSLAVP